MKPARGVVGFPNRERMLGWPGESEQLGLVRSRLGESAELGKAVDYPEATVDRDRYGAVSERLVDPVGGQCRAAIGGPLGRPLEVAPIEMCLCEIGRGQNTESQVPEAPGNLQRAGAGHQPLLPPAAPAAAAAP